jgi:hypothetical protein
MNHADRRLQPGSVLEQLGDPGRPIVSFGSSMQSIGPGSSYQ